jgi:hypothetical protein
MSSCLVGLAFLFFFIGIVQFLLPPKTAAAKKTAAFSTSGHPLSTSTSPSVSPVPVPSAIPVPAKGVAMVGNSPFSQFNPGDQLRVTHPSRGELTLHVDGRLQYTELWQRSSSQAWVPTGNTFFGLWLETKILLLHWQNRYYLLEEVELLSDADIARSFSQPARQFAQSNQTAAIYFSYPPAVWHIDDIGKFQIAAVEGGGFNQQIGAVGRFIHASGDSDRALVVEDYEGGSGQDVVWTGYKIQADGFSKI